jgi:uncharacterized cofD-like protein
MIETDAPLGGSLLDRERLRERERNELMPRLVEQRPTRIVCIGGGTGLPVVLKGLAAKALPRRGDPGLDITAIVAVSDDGGSSGKLRRSRGILPPGDIRNCLVALAGGDRELSRIFQYRFAGAKGLAGHPVGNLLIAALAELKGDFLEAVRLSAKLLKVRGTVLPSTLAPVELVARMVDGSEVVGERNIARAGRRVARVSLSPQSPPPTEGMLKAIRDADLIAIGPGSLYSSLLPNLLVEGVAQALRETRALKVLISNLMTQPGETDGMDCLEHVRAVFTHVGPGVDVVLANCAPLSQELVEWYRTYGGQPVKVDRRALIEFGVIPVEADLVKQGKRLRHDSKKLARCLLKLARLGL